MKHAYLLVLAFIISTLGLNAQQEAHFTQFMYNKLVLNPAYSGSRGVPTVSALYRNQWTNFNGAPKSMLASFHSPFISERVGVGVSLSNYNIGLQRDFKASLAYSYALMDRTDATLRIGLQGTVRSLGIDFDDAKAIDLIDQSIDNQRINDTYGNFGAGIYGTINQKFYYGFSVPYIYNSSIGLNDSGVETARQLPHFYLMSGAIIRLTDNLNLMPAVLFKYVKNAPFDADININLDIKEKVTTGISYRVGGDGPAESVDLLVFWQVHPQIGVGAAYDITVSNIRDYTGGSFELLLQADLKKERKKKGFSNPRFFM